MSDYKTKEGHGALFNNVANKKTDKHPDYTGNAMIGGKLWQVASWITESKSGNKYMSLKFSEYKPKTDEAREYESNSTDDAQIPF